VSDLKKKFEVMDYLKRNKSKFHNLSARKVRDEVQTMFDVEYSTYVMRKMMVASDIKVNVHGNKVNKISLTSKQPGPSPQELKDQLDRMEKKLDFVCDFIQYAKSGEVPQ
jgi:hypothetical protein